MKKKPTDIAQKRLDVAARRLEELLGIEYREGGAAAAANVLESAAKEIERLRWALDLGLVKK